VYCCVHFVLPFFLIYFFLFTENLQEKDEQGRNDKRTVLARNGCVLNLLCVRADGRYRGNKDVYVMSGYRKGIDSSEYKTVDFDRLIDCTQVTKGISYHPKIWRDFFLLKEKSIVKENLYKLFVLSEKWNNLITLQRLSTI